MINFDEWTDKEIASDALSDHKFVTACYNYFSNECQNPDLRNDTLKILNEEHHLQADVFTFNHDRGWYPIEESEQQKLQSAYETVIEKNS
ncbi:MAG: spore coat protein [Clostridiales bacterium]|jgi:spore coat protein CotF|nr:spore coat protein [Clostridiales bacterium]